MEKIRDSAGQKGTGKWTAISALDKGMPVTLIGEWRGQSSEVKFIVISCFVSSFTLLTPLFFPSSFLAALLPRCSPSSSSFHSFLSTGEAVFARCLSSLKNERVEASKQLSGPAKTKWEGDRKAFIEDIRQALYASKIISYAQGFMLLREAAKVYNWKLNYGGIALMWRGGCIIRRWDGTKTEAGKGLGMRLGVGRTLRFKLLVAKD